MSQEALFLREQAKISCRQLSLADCQLDRTLRLSR